MKYILIYYAIAFYGHNHTPVLKEIPFNSKIECEIVKSAIKETQSNKKAYLPQILLLECFPTGV